MTALTLSGCSKSENLQETKNYKLLVAVSIVPVEGFIEAVAGDLVDVVTIIPPGNSPANYQPTTKEMQALSDADIYFVIQVPTEESNILPKVYDFNDDIKLVNLRYTVSEIYPLRYMGNHTHDDEGHHNQENNLAVDPHIWLSPKRVILIIETIADELSALDEENEEKYQKNAENYIKELKLLDKLIINITDSMEIKAFMIYHGSYGYFADDYGLDMISIEADGKSATAAGIEEVIIQAKENDISIIFYQAEFDDAQAQTVAEEIKGQVVKSAPLSKDYIQSLTDFANALAYNREDS